MSSPEARLTAAQVKWGLDYIKQANGSKGKAMSGPAEWREAIAANVRAERARARLSQDQVVDQMRGLGFTNWYRPTLGRVERGLRHLQAEEAVGLAWVLKTSPAALVNVT